MFNDSSCDDHWKSNIRNFFHLLLILKPLDWFIISLLLARVEDLANLKGGDHVCLNGSSLIMSLDKFDKELDLDNFKGSSGRRFEIAYILVNHTK